jgi:polyhydroxyalkanoate synthesis regulator phasin
MKKELESLTEILAGMRKLLHESIKDYTQENSPYQENSTYRDIVKEEMERFYSNLWHKGAEIYGDIKESVDGEVNRILKSLNLPTKDDIDRLHGRLDIIEQSMKDSSDKGLTRKL